jgi:TrmH family RNA methyltransferase
MGSRYSKKQDFSYSIGLFPTIELLENQPKNIDRIVIHSKLSSLEGQEKLSKLVSKNGIKVEKNDGFIKKISKKENCYVLGVFKKYEPSINPKSNHLVLLNPSSTGNLGTIIRAMLGFGHNNLAIIKPAADIFHPDTVRASMGSIFSINFQFFQSFQEYVSKFDKHVCYLFMTNGEEKLGELKVKNPYSLVFGNEANGIPNNYRSFGHSVKIEQSDKIDSLNLAISTAVSLYTIFINN